MLLRPADFFAGARLTLFHGVLNQGHVAGMTAILAAWDQWQPKADARCVAYSLATTYHETAFKMLPVEEIGKGRGRPYGVALGPYDQVYYGRGLVQLTWRANYQSANLKLHAHGVLTADKDLEARPELALVPNIASAILVLGMTEGWFTGRKLADFFNSYVTSWVEARRIINVLDCAAQIAAYGEHFTEALKDGGWA